MGLKPWDKVALTIKENPLLLTKDTTEVRCTAVVNDIRAFDALDDWRDFAAFFGDVDPAECAYLDEELRVNIESLTPEERLANRPQAMQKLDISSRFTWETTVKGIDYSGYISIQTVQYTLMNATTEAPPSVSSTVLVEWVGQKDVSGNAAFTVTTNGGDVLQSTGTVLMSEYLDVSVTAMVAAEDEAAYSVQADKLRMYKSAYEAQQIDTALGRIINGELDASVDEAERFAESAAQSAESAKQYSGNPAKPINGTWWVWNAQTGNYEDTGASAQGGVFTMAVNKDGHLLVCVNQEDVPPPLEVNKAGHLIYKVNT